MAGAEVDFSKLHVRNTATQEAVHTNSIKEYSLSTPDLETTEEKEKLFTSFSVIFRSQNIPDVKCPLVALILCEHCYAKHWSEQPAPTSSDGVLPNNHPPATKLFAQTGELRIAQGEVHHSNHYTEEEEEVDVEGDWNSLAPSIPYDQDRALKLMRECDRHVDFACQKGDDKRAATLSGDEATNTPDEAQIGLEPKNISKEGWSRQQERVFDRAVHILDGERLARLALASVTHEPLKRRALLDRSAVKFRRLLSILCRWDIDLCRWLHATLLSSLSRPYLAAYLDILQSLRFLLPTLLEKLWSPSPKPTAAKSGPGKVTPITGGVSSSFLSTSTNSSGANISIDSKTGSVAGGGISNAGLNLLLKRPWDPAQSVLHQHKPVKLDPYRSPVVVVVPNGPHSSSAQARRHKVFLSHLQSLTTVAAPHAPPHQPGAPLEQWLEGCVCSVRARLAEYGGRDRPLVLLGWGVAALLACQISSVEPSVAGVVCLSLPFSGHTDARCDQKAGRYGDGAEETTEDEEEGDYVSTTEILQSMPCPVLLVQGDRDSKCSIPRLEAARSSLPHSSQLVVVCGGNGSLRLSSLHRYQAALTTSLVDRCLVDEISTFLSCLIPPRPEDPNSIDTINASVEGSAVDLDEDGESGSGAVHTYNNRKRKASGDAPTAISKVSRPASPKRSRPGTPVFTPAPPENNLGGPAAASLARTPILPAAALRLQTGTLVVGSSWEEAAHQLPATLSGTVGGGLVNLGGGGSSAVVLMSSGVPVGGGASTVTSVAGVMYSSSPQAALSAPASPSLMLTKEVANWQQHITPPTPTTPCTPTGRGGNKRGRRPGRGRGRGGRALPADQLIALGGGVGVAAQAHINSAGRRQSPSMSARTPRGSRGGGGRGTALPNLQTGNVATSSGYVIAQKFAKTEEASLMHPPQQQGLLNASRSASPRGMISLTGGSKSSGKTPGNRTTAASLKEQIAQASTSQAQLLAAVASITPQSPPRSPQSPATNSKITTISTSTVTAQQLAGQPVTIIQQQTTPSQQQSVQYQIQQQQPFSSSTSGTSFVVSNVGGVSFGRPLLASVLSSVDGTSSSASRRKSGNAAIMSAVTSSNIQKNPIMFQTSSGVIGSNRIILPNTMASSVSQMTSNVASMSTVTTNANGGHRLIRPNVSFTQTRMTTPLILASNQKTVHSLVGTVAGNDRHSNSAVYTNRVGGPSSSNIASSISLGSVQGLLANAKFVTSSSTPRGGTTLRGVVGRGGVIMSRGGILAGGRGSNLINSSRGTAVTGFRNLSPSVKRQLITVGGGGTKIGTALGVRGTNLVLTTLPISVSGVTSYTVGSSSSPLTVDASTCTSPSLAPAVGAQDGSGGIPVTSVRQIQQQLQQSPIVMQLHQKQDQHSTAVAFQHDQIILNQAQQTTKLHQLTQKQQQIFQNRPKSLHGHQILYTTQKASPQTFEVQGSLPSILKVQTATPHHVIKSNTSKNLPTKSDSFKSVRGVPVNTNTAACSSDTILNTSSSTASSSSSSTSGSGSTATGDAVVCNVQTGHKGETLLTETISTSAAFDTGSDAFSTSSGCFVAPGAAFDKGTRAKRANTFGSESTVSFTAAVATATTTSSGHHGTTNICRAGGTFIITEEPLTSEVSGDAAGQKNPPEISTLSDTVDVLLEESAAGSSTTQNSVQNTQDSRLQVSRISSESQEIELLEEVGHSDNSDKVVTAATQGFPTSSIVSVSCASVHDQDTSKPALSKPSHSHIKVLTSNSSNLPKLASTPTSSNSQTIASSKSGKSLPSVLMSSKSIAASSSQADALKVHPRFVTKVTTLTSTSVNFTTTSKSANEMSATSTTSSQSQNVDRRFGGPRASQTTSEIRSNFSQIVTVSTSGKSVTLSSSTANPEGHGESSEASCESSSLSVLRNTNFSASSPCIMTVGASEVFASLKTSSGQFTTSGASKASGPPVSVVSVSTASGSVASKNAENADDSAEEIMEVDVVQPVEKKNEPAKHSAVHVISTSQAFAYQNNNPSGGRLTSTGVPGEEPHAYRQATKQTRILVSKASASTTQTLSINTLRRASVPDVPPPSDNHQGRVHYVLKQRRPSNASAIVEHASKLAGDLQASEGRVLTGVDTVILGSASSTTHESRVEPTPSMSILTALSSNAYKTITSTSKPSFSKFETVATSPNGVESSVLSKQEPTKISLRDALNMSPDLTVSIKSSSATLVPNPQKLKTRNRVSNPSTTASPLEGGSTSSRDLSNAGTRSSEVIVVSTNRSSSELSSGKSSSERMDMATSSTTGNTAEEGSSDGEQKVLDPSGADLVMKLLDSASHESDNDSQIETGATLTSENTHRFESASTTDGRIGKDFTKEAILSEGEEIAVEQKTATTSKGDTSNRLDAQTRSEIRGLNAKTPSKVLANVPLDNENSGSKNASKSTAEKSKTSTSRHEASPRLKKASESDSGVTKRATRYSSGSDEGNQTPLSDQKSLNPEAASKSRPSSQSRPVAVESPKPLRLRSNAQNKDEKKDTDSSAADAEGKPASASTIEEDKPLRLRPSVSRITDMTSSPTAARRRPADTKTPESHAPTSPPGTSQRASSSATSSESKGPAKSHVQIMKQKTGAGGKLKKRASPRLSLTPYEQAAMLRSGKKRSSL